MYKVFSIESRKGGVGKTTIALNLAKALVDDDYDVLLIDCDITGTPITDAACHSLFWKNIVKPISLNNSGYNLIHFFENVYLKGLGLEQVLSDKSDLGTGKVHLIGSEIYNKEGKLIIDPRLLMDDLHSHWFLAMVREIADKFDNLSLAKNKAVILDNSPGYVGIGKSIREWLTSIGSDFAHFVLVSSLDEQDVESIISTAIDIERIMISKWRIAYLYDQILNNEGNFDKIKVILDENPEFEDFFYSLLEKNKYPSSLKSSPIINDYVSVVLNKVPSIYHDANVGYRINENTTPEGRKVIEALFPMSENGMPLNIIEYEASISAQFIESSIYASTVGIKQSEMLAKVCDSFSKKLDKHGEVRDSISQYNNVFKSFKIFKNNLVDIGYKPLVESMGDDLVSTSFINNTLSFVRSLGNVVLTEEEEIVLTKGEIYDEDMNRLMIFVEKHDLFNFTPVLHSLLVSLYKKGGYGMKRVNWHLCANISLLFKLFLCVQDQMFKEYDSYRVILMDGRRNQLDSVKTTLLDKYKDLLHEEYPNIVINKNADYLINHFFWQFYQRICYTIMRLYDCVEDFKLIMNACRSTIIRGGRIMDSDLRRYVQLVVSWKMIIYDSVYYNKLIAKPFEMQVIRDSLEKVVLKKENNGF